ncbi:ABC-2 type transporter [Corchorus olitorius]|uniref:ABC-2 type transporter n=1 Tax=Corchorus olitorius TaxID=93759 RepID=A0A1R3HD68_9ROSI|nr:ABC-2 type transporter [Corchorus olitorius]
MASALAGDDLARSMSSRRSWGASSSHRSWASASFREVWQAPSEVFNRSGRQDDEEELRWAAIERLPTYDRLRKGMLRQVLDNGRVVVDEVDVTKLGMQDKKQLMDSMLKVVEEDNEKFLTRLRDRTDRVGIEIPKIEVRFEHLSIEGDVYVGSRALPTLLNVTLNTIESILGLVRLAPSKKRKIEILKDVSGIVKPSRFFKQFIAFFGIHQMALSLFRFIAAIGRTQVVANTLALFGFSLLFNILFIGALTYLNPLGDSKAVVVDENENKKTNKTKNPYSGGRKPEGINMQVRNSSNEGSGPKKGMVLPFQPLSLAFNHINYYVDMPAHWSYWRHPQYNAVRFLMTVVIGILFGLIFWDKGQQTSKQQDLMNLLGAMYSAVLFLGATNASAVQSVVAIERTVFYRERAAGMYSELPYAFSQQIPIWWRWYYWASPVAWTLYGLVTSQVGDKDGLLEVPGMTNVTVKGFLKDDLGFDYDFLPAVAGAHIGWCLLFFFVFAYGIKFLNFQRR